MGALGKKLRTLQGGAFAHWCPGCDECHAIHVDTPNSSGARWTFDGNADAPTFSPSINIRSGRFVDMYYVDEEDPPESAICHYFLHAGRLEFLGDCTHALAGQTVDLPDFPE